MNGGGTTRNHESWPEKGTDFWSIIAMVVAVVVVVVWPVEWRGVTPKIKVFLVWWPFVARLSLQSPFFYSSKYAVKSVDIRKKVRP